MCIRDSEPSPYSVLQNYFIKPTSFYDIPLESAVDDDDDKLTLSDASSLGTGRSLTSIESYQSVKTLGNTTATGRSSVYSWGSEDVSTLIMVAVVTTSNSYQLSFRNGRFSVTATRLIKTKMGVETTN